MANGLMAAVKRIERAAAMQNICLFHTTIRRREINDCVIYKFVKKPCENPPWHGAKHTF